MLVKPISPAPPRHHLSSSSVLYDLQMQNRRSSSKDVNVTG
jgi:hypothetical protein